MKYYIKPFGVERSGANFAAELIKQNFDPRHVMILNDALGATHAAPILQKADIKSWLKSSHRPTPQIVRVCRELCDGRIKLIPLVIIKNPYSWSRSIYRWRRTRYLDYEYEFDLYNVSYKIYHALLTCPEEFEFYTRGFAFKYEDIIRNKKHWIKAISSLLGVDHNKEFRAPEYNLAYKFTEKDRKYYLEGEPFGLSEVEINRVTKLVDWELICGYYGYKALDPRDYFELSRQGLAKLTYDMRKSGVLEILNEYGRPKKQERGKNRNRDRWHV